MLANKEIYDLIQRSKKGDDKAFGILMGKYKTSVYYIILKIVKNKEDAEDLCSEVFSKVYYNLDMYMESYSFSTWLFKIASNKAIDFVRKQKKIMALNVDLNQYANSPYDNYANISSQDPDPETIFVEAEKEEKITKFIDLLPEDLRVVLEIRIFEGLAYKDIAEKTNLSMSTVKTRIHRGRNLLAKMLKEETNKRS